MEIVSKSVYYLKTRSFLVWPECPGDGSFNNPGEAGSSSYSTEQAGFMASLSGWEGDWSMRASKPVVYF